MTLSVALLLLLRTPLPAAFDGIWEGRMNGLPAVEIVVSVSLAGIIGKVDFPFHQREPGGKWSVRSRHSTPMLSPRLVNGALLFETAHRKFHGSSELGRT